MTFMNYLARHHPMDQQKQQQQLTKQSSINKRSVTLPTVIKKKKEIGDYVLCRTIGRGASGRVKLGIHKQTGEKVAIKMISRSQLTASTTTAKSVQRELAVLQLLYHPNLIDLRQVLQDTQYVYFVMEYLEGGELFHVLAERGKLPENEARHLFTQLITALTWCHAHHISHRDLKPENILLDKEKKNLKIADFGMAAMQPLNTFLKTSCGSPHYASPEIVRGKRYDGTATDVWSCGAILYAMMTGHLPFDDEHMGRLLAKIKTGRYRTLPDYLSPDAKDLIKRMLVVDPSKRMTMAEILLHPWLTNKSFLGTELKFLQQQTPMCLEFNPLNHPQLKYPIISSKTELDGRIWETLKVLWRGKTDEDILSCLTNYGCNLQKLTCKLLQERSKRLENQQRQVIVQHEVEKSTTSTSLPLTKSFVITEDVLMTPPLLKSLRGNNEDIESYILPTPYASSLETVSCCKTIELPPTPKSTFQQLLENSNSNTDLKKKIVWDKFMIDHNVDSFHGLIQQQQQNRTTTSHSLLSTTTTTTTTTTARHWIHDEGSLAQTEETRGSKANAADLFIMTKPVESTCISMQESRRRSAWWLCSKEEKEQDIQPTWWDKTFHFLLNHNKKPSSSRKVISIECLSKHEYETAGKLHQVLEECYHGKLTGRMYPHGKIVWSGIMKSNQTTLSFTCHMTKAEPTTIKINFIIPFSGQQQVDNCIQELLECLNKYEIESDWVTKTNGWIHPEIL